MALTGIVVALFQRKAGLVGLVAGCFIMVVMALIVVGPKAPWIVIVGVAMFFGCSGALCGFVTGCLVMVVNKWSHLR